MDLRKATPRVTILCQAGNNPDALEDVDNVVNATTLDTQGGSRGIQTNSLVVFAAILLYKTRFSNARVIEGIKTRSDAK